MILGAAGLLQHNLHPTEADIVSSMNGHICRCGTYSRVVRAVQMAAAKGGRAWIAATSSQPSAAVSE
jgi:aerobic-type carbon monoxide dehydrogenase small subunit (CoxS/CutS family)